MSTGPAADSLRAALDSVFAGPAYRWAARSPFELPDGWWDRLRSWLRGLQQGNPTLFRAAVVLLIVALAAILVHAAWVAVRTLQASRATSDGAGVAPRVAARDAAWHFAQADRLAAAGRRAEAMRLAFRGVALALDAAGALRFHPSQTPAEVARAARLAESEGARLALLVRGLYRHVFAGAPLADDEWRAWRASAGGAWRASAH